MSVGGSGSEGRSRSVGGSGSNGAAEVTGQREQRGSGSNRQDEMGLNIKGPKLAICG